jgi:chromate transport protein ChrA
MELEPGLQEPVRRGRAGGILGLVSVALLLAAFRWAHHWGPVADTIVSAWALATIGALFSSVWSLRTSTASRRFAKAGIAFTLVSLVALTAVGVLSAAGVDAAGACGGG